MKWNCKNPLVKTSFNQRFSEWLCSIFGHRRIGRYYGMPQSHCPDCGYINKGIASEGAKEWSEPYLKPL